MLEIIKTRDHKKHIIVLTFSIGLFRDKGILRPLGYTVGLVEQSSCSSIEEHRNSYTLQSSKGAGNIATKANKLKKKTTRKLGTAYSSRNCLKDPMPEDGIR